MTDSVTVDQCDRDAAAKLAEECNPEEAEWLVPFYQNGGTSPLAAAFARHRIAERERIQDAIIALLDDLPTGSTRAHAMRQCLKATEHKP